MFKKKIFDHEIYVYSGCVHIHSEHSFDSPVSVKKVVDAAKKVGLDFITFNDHLSLGSKDDLQNINCADIITIPGYEMHDPKKNNHYLVYNTEKAYDKAIPAKEYVENISKKNGIGFIAHPFEIRKSKLFRKYEWNYWDTEKFDGIEIWNYLSQWTDSFCKIPSVVQSIAAPNLTLSKPLRKSLDKWDEYNKKGLRKSGIGGVDAHGKSLSIGTLSLTLLPHKKLFKTIRTNIWMREKLKKENSQEQILAALKNGNSVIVNYANADPEMFYCGIFSEDKGKFALPGEEISLSVGKLRFYTYLPQDCHISVIHNGERIISQYQNKLNFEVKEPGFYRVEILRGIYGWIYSNPIYVTE